MNFFNKADKALHSRAGAYISFVLASAAAVFLNSASWAYGWIAELYPLGKFFVPVLFGIIGVSAAVSLILLVVMAMSKDKNKPLNSAVRWIHLVFQVLSLIAFIYTFALLFGADSGFARQNLINGYNSLLPNITYLLLAIAVPLVFVVCENVRKSAKAIISVMLVICILASFTVIGKIGINSSAIKMPKINFTSKNLTENAEIAFESLKKDEKPDAANLLADNEKCWTAQYPARNPAEGHSDQNNSVVEIKLAETYTFNTALIEEVGNQAQYFRLQAFVDGEWITVYRSEKIQSARLCSFDSVTTDRVRLSIDKFRDEKTPVKIKSLKLYNEPLRSADDFEVTAYQRLDGDVPTEILTKGEEYVKNYARYYDVYTTVLVFAAVHWDAEGEMNFGDIGEEGFARELNALREIISYRSNKNHDVKIIVTALADGTWGEQGGVNDYMAKYWESIADKIAEFAEKYKLDGVDIDWEYPQSAEDWDNFNKFITRLDDNLKAKNSDSILSAALSAWGLGMSKDVLRRFDQIQFMAYDGNDEDGYQSSLQQAQEGLQAFADNGADISKINIGIAAYGRPLNSTPYWATWRDLKAANYWDNKYYSLPDADQIYDGTFCSPALAGDKTAYALFSGAGGVMVFRTGCDKLMNDPNSVACGIENTLKRYVENW